MDDLAEATRLLDAVEKTSAIPPSKAATLQAVLRQIRTAADNALKLLELSETIGTSHSEGLIQSESFIPSGAPISLSGISFPGDSVIEGVFDGEGMVGSDGKSYPVPPNYASKSKLVEGDILKLTIGSRGNFIYKQVGPAERERVSGSLAYDQEAGRFVITSAGRSWRVLKASVTYYHGEAGDEAVVLVPKRAPARWAALENIIKKNPMKVLEGYRFDSSAR
jgi:hypothetical protein